MNTFRLLPHTADIRLQAWGSTSEALFRAARRGMARLQNKGFGSRDAGDHRVRQAVQVRSAKLTQLQVNFFPGCSPPARSAIVSFVMPASWC